MATLNFSSDEEDKEDPLMSVPLKRKAKVRFKKLKKRMNRDISDVNLSESTQDSSDVHILALEPSASTSSEPLLTPNYIPVKSNDKYTEITNDNIDIIVHRLTPPFLRSEFILSNKSEINVIKDKTGDLYKYSHNGSHLVNERRLTRQMKSEQKIDEQAPQQINKKGITDSIQISTKSANLEIRKQLPAFKVRNELLNLINENQVVIVIGETGSGKTTQIPQFLYEAQYHKRGLIGITQPRRVAAVSVSKRVSEEMAVELGKEVGFSIRFNDNTSDSTKIKFMTDGILLREALMDNDLDKYSCIVMDEAHERSLNTDILLGYFKRLIKRRRDIKLVITSATMNYQKFSNFYGNAPCFFIPGKTFPVDIMYSSVPSVDYVDSAVKQALRIHLGRDSGDILIFMTGQEDIETTCESIREELTNLQKIDKSISDLDILPIYSSLSNKEQSKVFNSSDLRKCIIATNIAETSLTFSDVKFVIDSGLMKLKVFNPRLNMDTLNITPISKAQSNQRSGRAGRTSEGKAYRLYTLTSFESEMWANPIPEIQRSNLMTTILILKNMGVLNLEKFPFIDPPSMESLQTSEYELWSIGALDNYGKLTKLGKDMSNYPLDPSLSKLLILSQLDHFKCSKEVVKIISMLSVPNIFDGKVNDKKAESQRAKYQIEGSDHLTLLNIFNQCELQQSRGLEKWCKINYFNFKSIRQAIEIHTQLTKLITPKSCNGQWEIIKECLAASFMQNSAQFSKQNEYQHLRSGLQMFINPRSALFGIGDLPKFIIFNELVFTGHKQYLQCITEVKGQWLVKYGGIFFDKRERGITNVQHQREVEQKFLGSLNDAKNEKSTQ